MYKALTLLMIMLVFALPAYAAEPQNFTVTKSELESKIADELVKHGVGNKVKTIILGRRDGGFYSSSQPFDTHIDKVEYEKTTGKFTAKIQYFQDGALVKDDEITGRYDEMQEVPVLKGRLGKGAVISEDDIDYMEFATSRLRGDVASQADEIIGKSLKRTVSQNRPIKLDEIESPILIKRNDMVTIIYKTDRIEIKTTGTAIQQGAIGEIIQVKNEKSGAVVRGKVAAAGIVSVMNGE